MIARRTVGLAVLTVLVAFDPTGSSRAAHAQMMLPGANNGNALGAPPKAAGGSAATPTSTGLRPIVIKPPAEDTIIGQVLSRDGKSGTMTFDKVGTDLALSKLKLDGDKISKPQESCSIDISITTPIVTTPVGRPSGTLRFDVPLEACPFTIDVLDGAVLVSRADPSCDFTAADCRVTPGGLWGPKAIDITPSRATELEHQRQRIETTMRTNFRALIKKAGKDRAAVKDIARDQAAFSSQREMTCRDYDQESVHGFCSTQITEARALELLAKFGSIEETPAEKKRAVRTKTKIKSTATAGGAMAHKADSGAATAPSSPSPAPTELPGAAPMPPAPIPPASVPE